MTRPEDIERVEEALYGVLKRELEAKSAELRNAGLRAEVDPIYRSGRGSSYTSYVEATLHYADGDVHDVLFFYVARDGRLRVEREAATKWIVETIDDALAKAG